MASTESKATMTASLTVIPAVVHDTDKALEAFVDAKRTLDTANQHLAERERANVQMLQEPAWRGKRDEAIAAGEKLLEPRREAVERARADFEVKFAIYQEAARAREAKTANALAESNNAAALASTKASERVAALTIVLTITAVVQTIAAILQIWHAWSHP